MHRKISLFSNKKKIKTENCWGLVKLGSTLNPIPLNFLSQLMAGRHFSSPLAFGEFHSLFILLLITARLKPRDKIYDNLKSFFCFFFFQKYDLRSNINLGLSFIPYFFLSILSQIRLALFYFLLKKVSQIFSSNRTYSLFSIRFLVFLFNQLSASVVEFDQLPELA